MQNTIVTRCAREQGASDATSDEAQHIIWRSYMTMKCAKRLNIWRLYGTRVTRGTLQSYPVNNAVNNIIPIEKKIKDSQKLSTYVDPTTTFRAK